MICLNYNMDSFILNKKTDMLKKLNRWFELNLGWFFINGRKQEQWNEYLKNKYKK
tara:strand:+ start:11817 stop:11981 length:165 start_codon:yes stop_codon:yes gene_type:complete